MRFQGRGRATLVVLLLAAAWLAACATGADVTGGGEAQPDADGPGEDAADGPVADDADQADAGNDAELGDAPQDVEPDAGEDAGADADQDVTGDEQLDASDEDGSVDAPEDTGPDQSVSEAGADAMPDQSVAEASADAPEDASEVSQDGSPDTGPDGPDDAAAESAADSGCPVVGCDPGTQGRAGCADARVVGRSQASGAGYSIVDNTCQATNADDKVDPSCWDSAPDQAYRVYVRQGESLDITLKPALSCNNSPWFTALKIYSGATCDDTGCPAKDWCESPITDTLSHHYTATHDGWVTLVVDGYQVYDYGTYELKVVLTCNVAGCEC